MKAWRPFLAILVVYLLILGGALSSHLSLDGPIHQSSAGLFLVFAISSALIGLFSLAGALAAVRYSTGMALFIVASATLLKLWMVFVPESPHSIWEMVTILCAQLTSLVIVFGISRLRGLRISQDQSNCEQDHLRTRFSVRDLLVLTASFAILFAVLGSSVPSLSSRVVMHLILVAAGASAALVTASAFWLCLGTRWLWLRTTTCLLVAPVGGLVFLTALYLVGSLRFSWQWFAGVTATQMLLMIIPLAVMRMQGFRFVRGK